MKKSLTVGKKKDDAITKGAKIGAAVGGTSGVIGGLGAIGAAKTLGMGNKAALGVGAAKAIGGAVKGAVYGAGIGGLSTKVRKKKDNFSSNDITEFKKETDIVGQFPTNESMIKPEDKKTKKKKSMVEAASDTVKNKDVVPENVKGNLGTRFLMKK